jgi:hypothetical protein
MAKDIMLKFFSQILNMSPMENQQTMLVLETKEVMDTLEEKYILVSLIKLVKSLIISLMRLIWSYSFVCRPSILQTHLLSFDAQNVHRPAKFYRDDIWSTYLLNLSCNLTIILMI